MSARRKSTSRVLRRVTRRKRSGRSLRTQRVHVREALESDSVLGGETRSRSSCSKSAKRWSRMQSRTPRTGSRHVYGLLSQSVAAHVSGW